MHPLAILFDIGGTLIHLNPKVFELAVQKYLPDYRISSDFRQTDINSKTYALLAGNDIKSVHTRYFSRILKQLNVPREFLDLVVKDLMETSLVSSKDLWNIPDESAVDVLTYLQPKYKLGVISNNVGDARIQLDRAGLSHFFPMIIDSQVLGLRKPDPQIFLYAAAQMGVKPEECIYVGDMFEWDGLGPLNAHMSSILVSASPEDRESAKSYPSIRVVDSLSSLPTLL
jgi:putative hydrolase of the HAD superfamily